MPSGLFAPDFRTSVYWLDDTQPSVGKGAAALPARVDAVVIGSGLTGSSAAHALAMAGRSVVVLDRGGIGEGASSRNAGMLGKGSRQSYLLLAKAAGRDAAKSCFAELGAIYDEAVSRIESEGFDCDFRRSGRFIGALRPDHLERLIREYEARADHLGEKVEIIRGTPEGIVGSQNYYGGVLLHDGAAVNPAAYTAAMIARARKAGAVFLGHTMAKGVRRAATGFEVATSRGAIKCRNVVVATNGYGGGELPWAAARLVPINAYMIATGELPRDLIESVCPGNSTYVDSTRANRYFQATPDGRRLVFGGRTGRRPLGPLSVVARRIHADMVDLFPQLAEARIARVWAGRCAASLDDAPHVAEHDGIHYAVGFSFTGLALAPYLGRLAGQWVATGVRPQSIFAGNSFPAFPLGARFLRGFAGPIATRYFAWVDRPVPKAQAAIS